MRLSIISDLESRDGAANKDARLTNALMEVDEGARLACLRPGLASVVTATGAAGGQTAYNGELITVFGTVLGVGEGPTALGAVIAGTYDFAQSPL